MTNQTEQDSVFEAVSGGITNRRRLWFEAGLITAFWTCIFLFTIGERALDPRGPAQLRPGTLLHTAFENALWLLATPGIFWLTRRYSLESNTWPRILLLHLATAFGAAITIDYVSHTLFPVLSRPYSLARSLLDLGFLDELVIALVVLTAGFARAYFLRYQERRKDAARFKAQATELQAQLAEARLAALRMQINPHFLFNTLHAVSSFIDEDPPVAQRIIARLSKLLRYALDNTDVQEVPLREELQFLRDYLDIQRLRFEGQLETAVEVPSELHEALVPSLILQPLVENAVKHGAGQTDGIGRVVVRARREGKHLLLSVHDNGPGFDPSSVNGSDNNRGVGLRNTRERLENLYGSEANLSLQPAKEGGLVARITIPYHTSSDLSTTVISPDD